MTDANHKQNANPRIDISAASATLHSIPFFHFEPARASRNSFDAILLKHDFFHQIADIDAFYEAMGCKYSGKDSGLKGDECIWDRYTRDGAKMSHPCLQMQIHAYLHKNSTSFTKLYGDTYDAMIGKCALPCVESSDEHCSKCPMHPHK